MRVHCGVIVLCLAAISLATNSTDDSVTNTSTPFFETVLLAETTGNGYEKEASDSTSVNENEPKNETKVFEASTAISPSKTTLVAEFKRKRRDSLTDSIMTSKPSTKVEKIEKLVTMKLSSEPSTEDDEEEASESTEDATNSTEEPGTKEDDEDEEEEASESNKDTSDEDCTESTDEELLESSSDSSTEETDEDCTEEEGAEDSDEENTSESIVEVTDKDCTDDNNFESSAEDDDEYSTSNTTDDENVKDISVSKGPLRGMRFRRSSLEESQQADANVASSNTATNVSKIFTDYLFIDSSNHTRQGHLWIRFLAKYTSFAALIDSSMVRAIMNATSLITDERVACVTKCEDDALLKVADKKNKTGLTCFYSEAVHNCLTTSCNVSNCIYASSADALARDMINESCTIDDYESPPIIPTNDVQTNSSSDAKGPAFPSKCLQRISEVIGNSTVKVEAELASCGSQLKAAESQEARCQVLEKCILGSFLKDFVGEECTTSLSALAKVELAQFSDGRLLNKCPNLYNTTA